MSKVTSKIKINKVEDISKFVHIAMKYNFDIDLISGRYIIDAKSIVGIYNLDLSKEIGICVNTDLNECRGFIEEINCFLTDNISETK